MQIKTKIKRFLQSLGPGILFASTAIGVSHLVQSTRAGSMFGFGLLWAVILANLFKWPFFEYGSRYANAAGESIIDGYNRIGKWMLLLYFAITLVSMFFVAAAVGAVTAGFMDNLFRISETFGAQSMPYTTAGLFLICILILLLGKYKALDRLIKVVGSVLLVSTLIAVLVTFFKGPASNHIPFFSHEAIDMESASFGFLIALMGWMPTAVDLSAWNSLWTLERIKQSGFKPRLRETLREFNFGYMISALLAPCFMLLGAYILFGTEQQMPEGSAAFASNIIGLYTENIGPWSRPIITAAAFSIMFGTCLGVFDGYSRATERIFELLFPSSKHSAAANQQQFRFTSNSIYYNATLLIIGVGAFWIIFQFANALKSLVDLATSISFIVAPIIAVVNFKLVLSLPKAAQPKTGMRWLSYAGIVFLTAFTIIYLFWIFKG